MAHGSASPTSGALTKPWRSTNTRETVLNDPTGHTGSGHRPSAIGRWECASEPGVSEFEADEVERRGLLQIDACLALGLSSWARAGARGDATRAARSRLPPIRRASDAPRHSQCHYSSPPGAGSGGGGGTRGLAGGGAATGANAVAGSFLSSSRRSSACRFGSVKGPFPTSAVMCERRRRESERRHATHAHRLSATTSQSASQQASERAQAHTPPVRDGPPMSHRHCRIACAARRVCTLLVREGRQHDAVRPEGAARRLAEGAGERVEAAVAHRAAREVERGEREPPDARGERRRLVELFIVAQAAELANPASVGAVGAVGGGALGGVPLGKRCGAARREQPPRTARQ